MTTTDQASSRRDDAGQVIVMILGFFVLVSLMTVVVVDASAAYLQRRSLENLADGAALAAADGVQGRQVYAGGLGDTATVDPVAARRYVRGYLRASGSAVDGLRWYVTTDGEAVRVHIASTLDLPLSPPGWSERTPVTAEAAVRLNVY